MTRRRAWLKANKVYFEVVSSILFGGAAVLIAFASYTVSERQLRTAELAAEPHFFVEKMFVRKSGSKVYTDQEMRIHNGGSPVSNVEIDCRTFIEVRRFSENEGSTFVPIIGYYSGQVNRHVPVGHLSTFIGHSNNNHVARMQNSLLRDEIMNQYGYSEMSVLVVLLISYTDRMGRSDVVYFLDRERVTEGEVAHLLDIDKKFSPEEFTTLTADGLMTRVQEIQLGLADQ